MSGFWDMGYRIGGPFTLVPQDFYRGCRMRLLQLAFLTALPLAASAQTPITLSVDLTDAPRKIIHATETMPVQPGPMTLVYPKWIPGEHMPSGPIDNQAGFVISANGQPVKWERDSYDMFAFHITVPAGVTKLDIKMDFLATAAAAGFSAGASTSANLALLSWNSVIVYPDGMKASDVTVTPSIDLPKEWKFGTALQSEGDFVGCVSRQAPQQTTCHRIFNTVSLEQLIDSPVLAGRWFREIPLAPEISPKHFLDLAGDGPEDIAISQEHIDDFSKLIRETGALYQSRHYGSYHFLVTLSDQVSHFGLEHHQSSDDRVAHNTFSDDNAFIAEGLLLPHEFTHSWNGKYRRPAGLATPNYQKPMAGDLLWVYEGLTEYLGDVLAARCGIWSPAIYRDRLATVAGYLNDVRPGRTWRDLQDTATMAQVLYTTGGAYDNWRRNTDYYDEGELLWLEADLVIRDKTNGKKSLNDFAASFEGLGGNTAPKVVPYTFEDVVAGLNAVVPYDWSGFLHKRLDSNEFHAPETAGIGALSGYKLVYVDHPNYWSQLGESLNNTVDTRFSIGLQIGGDGRIGDVIESGIGDKAGFGPGMKVIAVNGRTFTPALLRAAIKEAAGKGPAVEFIVENTGYYKVIRLDYHDGEKYPDLQRVDGTPSRLDDILTPMTK
jgi:predicted metalloprotease with PDZ domain